MMKSSELLIIVDSVEEAVKYYTEKLAFDIIDVRASSEHPNSLQSAHLRKGKCLITFKQPHVEEFAEFSFIKRCASRCVGLYMEMKKGLDKYYSRCQKKGVKILSEPKTSDGIKSFTMRDPFGIKLIVAEVPGKSAHDVSLNFVGLQLSQADVISTQRKEKDLVNAMVGHLKTFGVLRRAAKKFAKQHLKKLTQKK
jgi:uncharacterized glyoxalase superfamily protein PhnB